MAHREQGGFRTGKESIDADQESDEEETYGRRSHELANLFYRSSNQLSSPTSIWVTN